MLPVVFKKLNSTVKPRCCAEYFKSLPLLIIRNTGKYMSSFCHRLRKKLRFSMPGRPLSEILKTSEENETTGYNKDETDENDVGDFEEDGPLIQ